MLKWIHRSEIKILLDFTLQIGVNTRRNFNHIGFFDISDFGIQFTGSTNLTYIMMLSKASTKIILEGHSNHALPGQ